MESLQVQQLQMCPIVLLCLKKNLGIVCTWHGSYQTHDSLILYCAIERSNIVQELLQEYWRCYR